MSQLRRAVASHFNSLPPHPGYDAHSPPPSRASADRVQALFTPSILRELETSGYVVLDDAFASGGGCGGGGGSVGGGGGGGTHEAALGALHSLHAFLEREGEKTGQTEHRSDRVKFLSGEVRVRDPADRVPLHEVFGTTQHDPLAFGSPLFVRLLPHLLLQDAAGCGVASRYDFLMAIAPFLNDHLAFAPTPYAPVAPGTATRPLTNPRHVQAAVYGLGDSYVAHSDNGLDGARAGAPQGGAAEGGAAEGGAAEGGAGSKAAGGGAGDEAAGAAVVRRNLRCYTCILYLTGRDADGAPSWTEADGGALALHRNSEGVRAITEATAEGAPYKVADVQPLDGRLLVFDSRLVHAVRPNTSADGKLRTALTLWITRPTDEPVRGEVWDEGGAS